MVSIDANSGWQEWASVSQTAPLMLLWARAKLRHRSSPVWCAVIAIMGTLRIVIEDFIQFEIRNCEIVVALKIEP